MLNHYYVSACANIKPDPTHPVLYYDGVDAVSISHDQVAMQFELESNYGFKPALWDIPFTCLPSRNNITRPTCVIKGIDRKNTRRPFCTSLFGKYLQRNNSFKSLIATIYNYRIQQMCVGIHVLSYTDNSRLVARLHNVWWRWGACDPANKKSLNTFQRADGAVFFSLTFVKHIDEYHVAFQWHDVTITYKET